MDKLYGVNCIATPHTIGEDMFVMQYTGLKDKNGFDIFDGDILKWSSFKPGYENGFNNVEVIWHLGSWKLKGNECWNLEIYTNIEKIGNIHENPELLGAKDA